jgi:hypothetical protein
MAFGEATDDTYSKCDAEDYPVAFQNFGRVRVDAPEKLLHDAHDDTLL